MDPTTTPVELRTQFETIIDDVHDITHTYQLLTQAKNWVETFYKLRMLWTLDVSQNAYPGDNYLTFKSLPTDWKSSVSMWVGVLRYRPCNFAERIGYRLQPRRYYVDVKNKQFALTGTVAALQNIAHTYIPKTPALTEANEEVAGVCLWPDEFQPLIAYQAAQIFQGNIDADDTAFRMSQQQMVEYNRLLDALIVWDHDLKLEDLNDQLGYDPDTQDMAGFDLGLL